MDGIEGMIFTVSFTNYNRTVWKPVQTEIGSGTDIFIFFRARTEISKITYIPATAVNCNVMVFFFFFTHFFLLKKCSNFQKQPLFPVKYYK